MKARFATILSLVGVLSAGSAAAMVNTSVLAGSTEATTNPGLLSVVGTPTPSSVQLPTTEVGTDSPAITDAPTPDVTVSSESGKVCSQTNANPAVVTKMPSATTSAPVTSSPESVSKDLVYNVGEAASISVQLRDGTLSITAAIPCMGWRVSGSNPSTDSAPATVILRSSSVEVIFTVSLAGGDVVTNVTSRSLTTSSIPGPDDDSDDSDDSDDDSDDSDDSDDEGDEDEGDDD